MVGISIRAAPIKCPGHNRVACRQKHHTVKEITLNRQLDLVRLYWFLLGISIYFGSISTIPSQIAVVINLNREASSLAHALLYAFGYFFEVYMSGGYTHSMS